MHHVHAYIDQNIQDGKLTGERNGSHNLDSAWQERPALSATGDQYHQTIYQLGHDALVVNALESNHKIVDYSIQDCVLQDYRS